MGGIANVATLPEFRGNGYNQELLKRAIAVMEADAMDFSMLGTGINAYYAKLGFATLPRPVWEGTLREQGTGDREQWDSVSIRAAMGDDLAAIREIYDVYNAKTPVAVQRYEAYWRDWVKVTPEKLLPNLLVATDPLDDVVGYISLEKYKGDGGVAGLSNVEFGLRGKLSESAKKATTRALFVGAIENCPDAARLRWSSHTDPIVLDVLREVLTDAKSHDNTSEMVRLLHRTNLMQSFTLAWNESWTAAGRPSGMLAFETPYGTTTINATGSFLRVSAEDNAPNALPQETFFGLLFGLVAPQTVTGKPETLELLNALFPPRSFAYWNRDGF